MDNGDYPKAIQTFEASIRLAPHFKTLELLGECHLRQNEATAAIIPLAAAVGLGNNEFRATYLLAEAYCQMGDKKTALKFVNRALEMKPDFKRAQALKEKLENV